MGTYYNYINQELECLPEISLDSKLDPTARYGFQPPGCYPGIFSGLHRFSTEPSDTVSHSNSDTPKCWEYGGPVLQNGQGNAEQEVSRKPAKACGRSQVCGCDEQLGRSWRTDYIYAMLTLTGGKLKNVQTATVDQLVFHLSSLPVLAATAEQVFKEERWMANVRLSWWTRCCVLSACSFSSHWPSFHAQV